jgi:hypothetical protein
VGLFWIEIVLVVAEKQLKELSNVSVTNFVPEVEYFIPLGFWELEVPGFASIQGVVLRG